jgi:hypothetical protein
MRHRDFRCFALVVLLLSADGSPAFGSRLSRVGPRSEPIADCRLPIADPIVPALDWSLGKFVASGGRPRIVQICVVVMCIALFILMRKLR